MHAPDHRLLVQLITQLFFYFFFLFACLDADLANYRVPGVLQRFAACYFIVSMLQLVINPGADSVLVNAHIPSLIHICFSINRVGEK